MAITIGSFSSSTLKVQPFGYEGEARTGRTATTLEFVGLLRPSEWVSFKSIYDTWRSNRIQDPDTLVSKTVGSTVGVSASANGVVWDDVECWFVDPPSATQVGAYIEVSGKLVDAAEALEVLLKEESEVDCDRIRADLEKERDEKDCEITALSDGLADDFAVQDTTLEVINRTAELAAKADTIDTLTDLDYQFEVQEKTAQAGAISGYAAQIAGLDADIEIATRTGELTARATRIDSLTELDYQFEVQEKTAQAGIVSDYAEDIAGLDADIEVATRTGELAAKATRIDSLTELDYQFEVQEKSSQLNTIPDYAEQIAGLDADIEIATRTGELAARATRIDSLTELDYQFDIQQKTSQLSAIPDYAEQVAGLNADIEIATRNAELAAKATRANDLAELDYEFEVQQKQAQVDVIDSYAGTIAALDVDLEVANSNASLAAFDETKKGTIAENRYDLEILETQVEIDALASKMTALKNVRELKALYDKELGEDLPNFGTQTLGNATIRLIEPAETRLETPSFSMTATGNILISGPSEVVTGKNIVGILTTGTISDVLAWYDGKVTTISPSGLFPTSAPEFTVESVLVNGAKGSRTTVQLSVVDL